MYVVSHGVLPVYLGNGLYVMHGGIFCRIRRVYEMSVGVLGMFV